MKNKLYISLASLAVVAVGFATFIGGSAQANTAPAMHCGSDCGCQQETCPSDCGCGCNK